MNVLQTPVLVLNKSWVPVNTTTAYEAICDVYSGKSEIVGENYQLYDFDQWVQNWEGAIDLAKDMGKKVISGVKCDLILPEVIRYKNYTGYKVKRARLSRAGIFQRDENTCQYCGRSGPSSAFNIDHIIPKSRGGKATWENLVLSCVDCNSKKGNRTPKEAKMPLIRKPTCPPSSILKSMNPKHMPVSWQEFLDKMYWNVTLED